MKKTRKIISIVLAVLMVMSVIVVAPITVDGASEADRIKQQISNAYSWALSKSGRSNFSNYCNLFTRYNAAYLGIININADSDMNGYGRDFVNNTSTGKTSTGWTKTKYSGSNCLSQIINANGGGNVYNIIVSWNHQYGASDSSPGAGHVCFIHAIINNTVYMSDNYKYGSVPEGSPLVFSLSDFMSKWNGMYGYARNAVHLTNGSPPSSFDPVGQVESVRVKYANTITIKGFAFDRDNDSSPVYVDVYAFQKRVARITANKQRDDVAAKHGVGKNHGFEETITMPKTGTYNIAIYAINIEGGKDTEIYYNSVTVKDTVYSPEGELESVESNSDNTLTLRGWAFDRENTSSSVYIDVYAFRNRVARITADKQREDTGNKYNVGNYHGFEETIKMPQAGEYNIAVYAINIGDGEDSLIYNNKVFVKDYSKQKISDGDYHIASALDLGCTINVAGGNSTESGANVHLWRNGGPIVTVKYLGDGYYSMVFKKSGMAMDVYNAGSADGTNVLQYKQTTNDNQKWIIKEAGDNYYFNIISKCNGLYLDVAGGSSADGTNIQMYHGNDTPSQKWRFYREPSYTDKSVEEGKYRITSKLANSLSLDIADKSGANMSNVQVFNREVKDMDTFDVEYLDNGLYTITPTNMNRRLDVVNNVPYNKADVQIYDKNTSASQKWILQPTDDGYYNIIAQGSGLYLDVSGGGKTDGTNVQVYLGNDTDSQKWKLSIVKNEEETSPATEPITTQPVTEKPTEITEIEPTEEPPIETTAGAVEPTEEPTAEPVTGVIEPTEEPTIVPTTGVIEPVEDMTVEPVTIEAEPTEKPTAVPTTEAVEPTEEPIVEPTTAAVEPTEEPTIKPTKAEVEPTEEPIAEPTTAAVEPTEEPIIEPTTAAIEPTEELIIEPTTAEVEPTEEATMGTVEPTVKSKDKTNNKKTSTPKSKKSKKKNTISVKAKTKSIKLKKLKKKAQTVKPLTVKKAKGKVTYKLIKKGTAKKIWKYLKISKKGAITVKKWKKAKKGTYKIKVKVTAAGNKSYRKGSKTVTAKIKIK